MWIVRLALRRPLSVAVMALLMLVLGALSFELMNVDIFPAIDLPVVLVVWNYPGLSAFDVERRMVFISERAYSTTVNGIEHIESESINGLGILKVYFQPGSRHRRGDRADQRGLGNHSDHSAARHRAAADHLLQRRQRAGRAAQHLQRHALDRAAVRLRPQLHPHPALHDSRLLVARAARRRAARGDGQSRSDRAVRQRAVAARRRQRAGRDQRGYPVGHRQDGQLRVQRRPQHERPARCEDFNRLPVKYRQRHAGLPRRRRPGDRLRISRRPTWCASMASPRPT